MTPWKAALRWLTLLPIALAAGCLGRGALVLLARLGLWSSGVAAPDSQEYASMSWLYDLMGDALAGGIFVWVGWRWAPSHARRAAAGACVAVCALGAASVWAEARAGDLSPLLGITATVVGALLAFAYVLGETSGTSGWLDDALTTGWHGVGQDAHQAASALLTLPLWWWAASPLARWREAVAGTTLLSWPFAAGGWLWRTLVMGLLAYTVAFATLLLLLLLVKLPPLILWHLIAHPEDPPPRAPNRHQDLLHPR
jgi:hypothetical protein